MRAKTDIDMFTSLAEAIEIGRERELVEQRERACKTQEMRDVISLGEQAVQSLEIQTTEDVVRAEWRTTSRQRAVMGQAGQLVMKPEMESEKKRSFDITSGLIKIAPDFGIVLRQTTNAVTRELLEDFWWRVKEDGIEAALDHHNKPEFTNCDLIDLRTQQVVTNHRLMPRSTWFPTEIASRFNTGTRPTALSLRSRSDCESPAGLADRPHSEKTYAPLTDDELLITAGFVAYYNLILDQVEACL